jgi:hypothetical protein
MMPPTSEPSPINQRGTDCLSKNALASDKRARCLVLPSTDVGTRAVELEELYGCRVADTEADRIKVVNH